MIKVFIVYYDNYQPKTCSVHSTRPGAEAEMIRAARAETQTDYDVDLVDGKRVHRRVPRYPMELRISEEGKLERYEPRDFGPPWNRQHVDWQFTDYWIEEHEVRSEE